MYRGKHLAKRKPSKRKLTAPTLILLLLLLATVGGTIAYLFTSDGPMANTFTPAHVSCEVTESFDGTTKSNVNVKNTGDIDAYVRVRLVSYRVNDSGDRIGGAAEIPIFSPGDDWFKSGNFYYYSQPVHAGSSPLSPLIGSPGITLNGSYTDADGGKQVIEVLAEAIQSKPTKVIQESWDVSVNADGNLIH